MTNLAHWQDDIEDALGGDFDGSLSGLCIMSLSFDFTRNGVGPQMGSSKENHPSLTNVNQQASIGNLVSASSTGSKSTTHSMNQDEQSEISSNCFKRFKATLATTDLQSEEENRLNNQNKIARQLQKLKNCLTANSPLNSHQVSNSSAENQAQIDETANDSDQNRLSPQASETSGQEEVSAPSSPNESSRSSTIDARSPTQSPSQSCSSPSITHSHASSRSQSPSDMSLHGCLGTTINNNNNNNNNNNTNNNELRSNLSTILSNQNTNRANETRAGCNTDNQQLSIYSVKDSILNGSTLKESSFTTSVITTTAPMHFKSIPHPFSFKQFPLSPYHQFSNSSLNHDFYDRYLSHDSHQPLQTPLIGIERTQDLLSLKLPPHGLEDTDSQRFPKEWPTEDMKNDNHHNNNNHHHHHHHQQQQQQHERSSNYEGDKQRNENSNIGTAATTTTSANNQELIKRKGSQSNLELQKGFPFNYKSNSGCKSNDIVEQHEPIDLNVSYDQGNCCDNNQDKNDIYNESMKHFNPDRGQTSCFSDRSKDNSSNHATDNNHATEIEACANMAHQYHGQESMFGIEPSKQKFQYVLAAPISAATKISEDTMTYLNQGQAYEIKLENKTDVSEAKKGFMCSIINIGFHERHMQQAENELWQQWSSQHPNERIFSVDMKLSYNVFGVESDGLNKYEFLWDSSKAAGVFIRISSISTEFTPKKHGGEKGVPFKLSIETFSYNSKTHDSYFISAACCQIKVFKPKGAERKIRSDRDKISKRPLCEQEKYHRSSDHTSFRECSLTSLHPSADSSLCYYRHSHGHFASKQVISTNSIGGTPTAQAQQTNVQQSDDEVDLANNASQQNHSPENQSTDMRSSQVNNDSETSSNGQSSAHPSDFHGDNRNIPPSDKNQSAEYSTSRISQNNHYGRNILEGTSQTETGPYNHHLNNNDPNFTHSNDLLQLQQSHPFNHMYHNNHQRGPSSLPGINNPQHFGVGYYGHSLPNSTIPQHIPSTSYEIINGSVPNITHHSHGSHNFASPNNQLSGPKAPSTVYRNLNQEKQNSTQSNSFGNPFRPTNLALASHSNFQSYSGNHNDQCEGSINDIKDSTMNGGSYGHENYDLPHFHSNYPHNQQQIRHRSSSMTLTNGNCSGYQHAGMHGKAASDGYMGTSGSNMNDNHPTPHHWNQVTGNQAHLTIPGNSNCARGNSLHHNSDNQSFSTSNFDCHNHQYDPDQHSPKKNHNHTSDSSSSCNSQFKHSTSIPCISEQDNYGISIFNSQITANSNCSDVVAWFNANRFGIFTKTFSNFSGSDLLRLSKTDLIEICGLIDGIRLYNSLHDQPIKPKRVLYVCHESSDIFHPIYLYKITLNELLKELTFIIYPQKRTKRKQKISCEKIPPNSSSSTDSRSSIGALSSENGTDENYGQGDSYFNNIEYRKAKSFANNHKAVNEFTDVPIIHRLLVDSLTSVKIVATDQVVQILENDSVWKLSTSSSSSGQLEACISACNSSRNTK